ncbi:YciI family protein [Paenibacillus sp. P25]|nr:YciI family protein [Paenibacillus sp. P25]
MMLTYETKEDFAARTDHEREEPYWLSWRSFIQEMKDAGVLFYPGNVLRPKHTAITVKAVDGRVQTIEGASEADSFPLLSGYFIIEVADAEEAVRWASLAPAAVQGSVESRPVM